MRTPARLDAELVRGLAKSFPGPPWQSISTSVFVADRGLRIWSNWSSAKHLEGVGGVYAILLPTAWFETPRILQLHAPHSHAGVPINYEFTVPELEGEGYGVVYVGRTANLCERWQGHLTAGERKDGGQVMHGLVDCKLHDNQKPALRELRKHARIIYTALPGSENCANRDILEVSLCARFGPAFNIKSER